MFVPSFFLTLLGRGVFFSNFNRRAAHAHSDSSGAARDAVSIYSPDYYEDGHRLLVYLGLLMNVRFQSLVISTEWCLRLRIQTAVRSTCSAL